MFRPRSLPCPRFWLEVQADRPSGVVLRASSLAFCENSFMVRLLILFLATAGFAQQGPRTFISHTSENLRSASVVSRKVAWASGTHGTYVRTVDGQHWTAAQVADAAALDFRAVVAFSAD